MARPDFGDRRPSDIGDVAPDVDAIIDQNGLISVSTNPITDNGERDCEIKCQRAVEASQRALEQAERALRAAQELANTGGIAPTDV